LSGWQLAATIIVGTFAFVVLVVFLAMREGRSRRFRIGIFIERENIPEHGDTRDTGDTENTGDTLVDSSDWPTKH
jgi:hypothetical protein